MTVVVMVVHSSSLERGHARVRVACSFLAGVQDARKLLTQLRTHHYRR